MLTQRPTLRFPPQRNGALSIYHTKTPRHGLGVPARDCREAPSIGPAQVKLQSQSVDIAITAQWCGEAMKRSCPQHPDRAEAFGRETPAGLGSGSVRFESAASTESGLGLVEGQIREQVK